MLEHTLWSASLITRTRSQCYDDTHHYLRY
jgi:hypothetical protein